MTTQNARLSLESCAELIRDVHDFPKKGIVFKDITPLLDSAPHFDGTRELFTVAAGRARVTAEETDCELAEGDTAHYRADVEHCIANPANDPLRGFLVVTYR